MSAGHNPMPHPDENLLAAFAEQALAGAERDSVLLHLSNCPRCREIVFLAQEAVPQQEPVAEVAMRPARRQWLRWQTATAGAWVVALAIAAALLWHSHRTSSPSDELVILQHAAPPMTSGAEEREPAKAAPAPPHPPSRVAKEIPNERVEDKKSLNARASFENGGIQNAPAVALKPAEPVQSFIAPPAAAPQQQNAIANDQLRSLSVAGRQSPPAKTSSSASALASGAPVFAPPAMFGASDAPAEPQSTATIDRSKPAAAGSAAARMAAPVRIAQYSVVRGKLRRLDTGGYTDVALPHGTTAHEVAADANLVLLLTRQRILYRSADYGDHWTRIPSQWSGRAAGLRLRAGIATSLDTQESAKKNAGSMQDDAASSAAGSAHDLQSSEGGMITSSSGSAAKTLPLSPPLDIFELTNSAGKRWLSRDGGQTWQPE